MDRGCHFWHIKYLHSSRPELPTISVGIVTLPIEDNIQALGMYNAPSMWVYASHNGMCYHKGAVTKLEEYSMGDIITIKLDLNENQMLIGKNGGFMRVAFSNLPTNETFYAFVNFNDARGNRQDIVKIMYNNKFV